MTDKERRKRVLILGAAGRDFHDFNVLFRADSNSEVVAFTANQIPYISDRKYPRSLSGKLYPRGIRIYDEAKLAELVKGKNVDVCIQAYSDLPYAEVMHKASIANANGADFALVTPERTMLKSKKPVIAVCAVRTGCGKSQTVRYLCRLIKRLGKRAVVIRHPMPYGDLAEQAVQRFEKLSDLDKYNTTIEEREDYEPHIRNGFVVYAGVDYGRILAAAEKEADIVIWDGGNNDAPFIRPDLMITVADPLRAGDELTYYPGEIVARMADILIINKVNSATKSELERVRRNLKDINSRAKMFECSSVVLPDNPRLIKGRSALVIEDGPSITHGGMRIGAGTVAAKKYGAREIVNAKRYAVGSLRETFMKYPALDKELPAMGYSAKQVRDLQNTINGAECDIVISATPTNLRRIINVDKPVVQVGYELAPKGRGFDNAIRAFVLRRRR